CRRAQAHLAGRPKSYTYRHAEQYAGLEYGDGNQGGRTQSCLSLDLLKLLAQEFHRVGHHRDRSDHPTHPQDGSLLEEGRVSGNRSQRGLVRHLHLTIDLSSGGRAESLDIKRDHGRGPRLLKYLVRLQGPNSLRSPVRCPWASRILRRRYPKLPWW